MVTNAEEIVKHVRDDKPSQDLGLNFPLFLERDAELGKFPEPDEVGGVDYKAMTKVVASLMRGYIPVADLDIPTKLDTASTSRLRSQTERLVNNLMRRFPMANRFRNRWIQFLSHSVERDPGRQKENYVVRGGNGFEEYISIAGSKQKVT